MDEKKPEDGYSAKYFAGHYHPLRDSYTPEETEWKRPERLKTYCGIVEATEFGLRIVD